MPQQYIQIMFAERPIPSQQVIPCNRSCFPVFTCGISTIGHNRHAKRLLLPRTMHGRAIPVAILLNIVKIHIRLKLNIERQRKFGKIMSRQHTSLFIAEIIIIGVIPIIAGPV